MVGGWASAQLVKAPLHPQKWLSCHPDDSVIRGIECVSMAWV